MEYLFEHRDKVRDYECDLQGIVNNANYQHYTEHARHEFLLANGISFAELHEQGIDCVVAKIEMRFKVPLRSRDEYAVRINMVKEGLRYLPARHLPNTRQYSLPESEGRGCMPDKRKTGRH